MLFKGIWITFQQFVWTWFCKLGILSVGGFLTLLRYGCCIQAVIVFQWPFLQPIQRASLYYFRIYTMWFLLHLFCCNDLLNFQKFCECVDATFLFPYESHDNCSIDSRKKWSEVLHSNNLHIDKKIYFSSFSVNFSKLQLLWTYWLQLRHDFENFMSLFENFWFWVLTRFLAVICPRNDPVY